MVYTASSRTARANRETLSPKKLFKCVDVWPACVCESPADSAGSPEEQPVLLGPEPSFQLLNTLQRQPVRSVSWRNMMLTLTVIQALNSGNTTCDNSKFQEGQNCSQARGYTVTPTLRKQRQKVSHTTERVPEKHNSSTFYQYRSISRRSMLLGQQIPTGNPKC